MDYLVKVHESQIADGLTPEQVKFTTSLPKLRDASVAAIVDVYNFMNGLVGRDLVKKAWERCIAKGWNLSGDFLTSKKAHSALNEYLRTHPKLRDEIQNRTGVVHGFEDNELISMDDEDDSDVPSSAVIEDALGITGLDSDFVDRWIQWGDDENIWAWNNGEKWGDDLPTISDD
ncbi:hypothetical protein BJ138DRAFT_1119844 [Hygrophoropsis aurantiaca]|uniref:Uncharacterized protein n=1 Tax=Hygrophoropsis aurantiaca TaxID=72124 RepID=A0ACB7ZS73_9AGAM|nr:hypothetical protein BJ138DRAFT_1119844 [Hygrophoropsis aurantiaca]